MRWLLLIVAWGWLAGTRAESAPAPESAHWANVFSSGQEVVIRVTNEIASWALSDYEGRTLRSVRSTNRTVSLGPLLLG